MPDTQDIAFGTSSQVLRYRAPYRASSVASCTVYPMGTGDSGTAEAATTGSPAVEAAPDTNVDANSGANQTNPRILNVDATNGFEIDRTYIVQDADQRYEYFQVASIQENVSVTATAPLHGNYQLAVPGHAVESTYIEQSLLDSWVQDEANISDDMDPNPGYRVRWVFTATAPGGSAQEYVRDSFFDLVRYPADYAGVSPTQMDNYFPGWLDILPDNHRSDQGLRILAEAKRQLRWDLQSAGIADEMVRSTEAREELIKPRAVLQLLMSTRDGDDPSILLYHTEYHRRLQGLLTVASHVAQSTDGTGAGRKVAASNLWRR